MRPLLQETLIRGFHSVVSAVHPIENPRAYLLRIASHAWIDELRRRDTEKRLAPAVQAPASPVFRLAEEDGRVSQLLACSFCPETVRAVGAALGYAVRTGLYRPPEPPPARS
jgi:DNA-directed RNA polymerase specialized sigma24 family protein